MVTPYQEICLRVSERLGIPVEEVIHNVEEYSKDLAFNLRQFKDVMFDYFGIASLMLRHNVLQDRRKNGYFKDYDISEEHLDVIYNKAKILNTNNMHHILQKGKYFNKKGFLMSKEEIDAKRKVILGFCKEPKSLREIMKLGYTRLFTVEQLQFMVKEGLLKLSGFKKSCKYRTIN